MLPGKFWKHDVSSLFATNHGKNRALSPLHFLQILLHKSSLHFIIRLSVLASFPLHSYATISALIIISFELCVISPGYTFECLDPFVITLCNITNLHSPRIYPTSAFCCISWNISLAVTILVTSLSYSRCNRLTTFIQRFSCWNRADTFIVRKSRLTQQIHLR